MFNFFLIAIDQLLFKSSRRPGEREDPFTTLNRRIEMKNTLLIAIASAILVITLAGCGESEESRRNLKVIAREAEARRIARKQAETERQRKIEEAHKWHRIQMEAYEKSMTPKKK